MLRPSLCSTTGHICQPHSRTLGLRAAETPDSSPRERVLWWSFLQHAKMQGRQHRWDAALPATVTVVSVPMATHPPAALFHWLPHPPVPTRAHPCPPTLTWRDQPGPEAAEPQEEEQRQQPHGMDGQCGGCLSGHRKGFKFFLGQKVGAHDLAHAPAPDTLHPSVNPPVPSLLPAAAAGQASGEAGRCCCLVQGSVQPQESRAVLQDKSSQCNLPLQQAGPGDPAWGWPGESGGGSPGRALWSSPWCPGSSPGIVLPLGTMAGS